MVVVISTAGLLAAQARPINHETQLTRGDQLFAAREYGEAFEVYQAARASDRLATRLRAGTGAIQALLRLSLFADAARIGASVAERDSGEGAALAIHADALWAAGLFDEATARYEDALRIEPDLPAGLHGKGRSLAARRQFASAGPLLERAARVARREAHHHYTLAQFYEDTHRYQDAADALDRFGATLPWRDVDDLGAWAEAQAAFLRSFRNRTPYALSSEDTVRLPLVIEDDRARLEATINGREPILMTLDTGADRTTLTPAIASRSGVVPSMSLRTAGVGGSGFGYRGLQTARIDRLQVGSLTVSNVGALIKDPALSDLPRPEGAGFSPLSMGLSMEVDYARQQLTLARRLPEGDYPIRLPLWMVRLPFVRGTLNGTTPVNLAVDTAGSAISLSRRVAGRLARPTARLVPAEVYGTSGKDESAFLLPYVDLLLAPGVGSSQRSLVVINFDAPSALLGFELGGLLGHDFLKRYVVAIDLTRGFVGLRPQ
jgi:hypothetical protein